MSFYFTVLSFQKRKNLLLVNGGRVQVNHAGGIYQVAAMTGALIAVIEGELTN